MKIFKRICTCIAALYLIVIFNKATDPYFVKELDTETGIVYVWYICLWSLGKMIFGFALGTNLSRIENIIFNQTK